jgi:hypothetical protein
MIRKKLVTYSLFLLSAVLTALAMISAPAPAYACIPVCTGNVCGGGKLQARDSCTGQLSCVSFCATQ